MIQGVLFDMDGVLFDTERCYIAAEAEAARRMGVEGITEDYSKQFCGMNSRRITEILTHDFPGLDVSAYRALTKRLTFEAIEQNGLTVKPYVAETLQWLRKNGYKTSVASSTKTSQVQEFLDSSGLDIYFDAVVGGDQVESGKPAPDIFLRAAAQLGLPPQNCAAVEDSFNGVRSAHAAGCVTVMIPDLLPPDEEMRQKATVLKDMSLLPDFIDQRNEKGAQTGFCSAGQGGPRG